MGKTPYSGIEFEGVEGWSLERQIRPFENQGFRAEGNANGGGEIELQKMKKERERKSKKKI